MNEYPIKGENTTFEEVYDRFFGKITDDMYMEWTREDTEKDLYNILMDAIPYFEFPRVPLCGEYLPIDTGEVDDNGLPIMSYSFSVHLTTEEINILAVLMYNAWLQRQVASIENTRMKYSGSMNQALL